MLLLCVAIVTLSGDAFGEEQEDTDCSLVRAMISKQNEAKSWRGVIQHFGEVKGSEEIVQLKDKSYRSSNGGPWRVGRRIVLDTRQGDVALVRACRNVLDSAEPLTSLRYERDNGGGVSISFQAWIDKGTGLPVKTSGRTTWLNGKSDSWVTMFTYDDSLKPPV